MAESLITVKDSSSVGREIRTRQRGTVHTQATEPPASTSYNTLDLGEAGVLVAAGEQLVADLEIFNRGAVEIYVKAYNKATAPDSTDTPLRVWEILPGQAHPFQATYPNALSFPLGLGLRCTTGFAPSDTGAPTANACFINLGYRAG